MVWDGLCTMDRSRSAHLRWCRQLGSVIHHGDPERHGAHYYIPGMLRYFDHAKIVATCMPPRPFMMISPTEDEDMPREGVDQLIPIVKQAYGDAGFADRFDVRQPEGNHRFLVEYFEWMVGWFERFLVAKPRKDDRH